jgi:hypothetical protein
MISKNNQKFSFRPKVGKVDFMKFTTLNIKNIENNNSYSALQPLLENATYSKIEEADISEEPISTLLNFIQYLQV